MNIAYAVLTLLLGLQANLYGFCPIDITTNESRYYT